MADEGEVDVLGDFDTKIEVDNAIYDANELPSKSANLLPEFTDPPWLLEQGWPLDNCMDEKSKATIEKMLMEEQYYINGKTSRSKQAKKPKKAVKKLNPGETKNLTRVTSWSKEEKDLLIKGIEVFGKCWDKIADIIPSKCLKEIQHCGQEYLKLYEQEQQESIEPVDQTIFPSTSMAPVDPLTATLNSIKTGRPTIPIILKNRKPIVPKLGRIPKKDKLAYKAFEPSSVSPEKKEESKRKSKSKGKTSARPRKKLKEDNNRVISENEHSYSGSSSSTSQTASKDAINNIKPLMLESSLPTPPLDLIENFDGFCDVADIVTISTSAEESQVLEPSDEDIDVDIEDDSDNDASNPLLVGRSVSPNSVYQKLIKDAKIKQGGKGDCADVNSTDYRKDFGINELKQPHRKYEVGIEIDYNEVEAPELEDIKPDVNKLPLNIKQEETVSETENVKSIQGFQSKESGNVYLDKITEESKIDKAQQGGVSIDDHSVDVSAGVNQGDESDLNMKQEPEDTLPEECKGKEDDSQSVDADQDSDTPAETEPQENVLVNALLLENGEMVHFPFPTAGIEFDTSSPVSEEEKIMLKEFFEDRPTKTPARYIRIRNYILDCWRKTKPNFVNKTSIRSGLKNCGDVNSIGRVHAYLECIGAINFGCDQVRYKNPHQVKHLVLGRERTRNEMPKNFKKLTSTRERKPKRVRDELGLWTDPCMSEGVTISPDGTMIQHARNESKESRPKQPRQVYDPFKLIPCLSFTDERPAQFTVVIHSGALMVMDIHSHISKTEVIGLMGGHFSLDTGQLTITMATPCNSVSTGLQCEMDPVSQTQACMEIQSKGLEVVGWYHSHPYFAPNPSIRDMETQLKFQDWFAQQGGQFVGVILRPFNPRTPRLQAEVTCLTVSGEQLPELKCNVPYKFLYTVCPSDGQEFNKVVLCAQDLASKYASYPNKVDLSSYYRDGMTCLDKMVHSLRSYSSLIDVDSYLNQIRDAFTSMYMDSDSKPSIGPDYQPADSFRIKQESDGCVKEENPGCYMGMEVASGDINDRLEAGPDCDMEEVKSLDSYVAMEDSSDVESSKT